MWFSTGHAFARQRPLDVVSLLAVKRYGMAFLLEGMTPVIKTMVGNDVESMCYYSNEGASVVREVR